MTNPEYYITKHDKDIRKVLQKGDLIFYNDYGQHEKLAVVNLYPNRDGTQSLGANFYRLDQLKITMIITKEQLLMNCYRLEE